MSRSMEACPALTDPVWLTALASLVTSLATLVWAIRRTC
jgi:hypothetical protein